MREAIPRLLRLVDYENPILRQVIKPIEFPLSENDQQSIRDMKYSIQREQLKKAEAPSDTALGMAANQWGINKRIFLFCHDRDDQNPEVIINPSYQAIAETALPREDLYWEGCFSIPFATGNIKRYLDISVQYQNEEGTIITKELHGWPARVWQHETDHLNGILYDDPSAQKCLEKKQFSSKEEVVKFREDKKKEKQE